MQNQESARKEQVLNLKRLQYLIESGFEALKIGEESTMEVVLCIGDTGCGKSTILSFLAGSELKIELDGINAILHAKESFTRIGHKKMSETSIPQRIVLENSHLILYDCPGFRDNNGQQEEIGNSFFIQKLLEMYSAVKIMLVVNESHLSEARSEKLPTLLKNLVQGFKGADAIKDGILMVINRAEPLQSIQRYLEEASRLCDLEQEGSHLLGMEERKLLKHLISKSRIVLFGKAEKEKVGQNFSPFLGENAILQKIKSLPAIRPKQISNIISHSAKLAIRDYLENLNLTSNQKVHQLCQAIAQAIELKCLAGLTFSFLVDLRDKITSIAHRIRSLQPSQASSILKILSTEFNPLLKCEVKYFGLDADIAAVNFFEKLEKLSKIIHELDRLTLAVQREQVLSLSRADELQSYNSIELSSVLIRSAVIEFPEDNQCWPTSPKDLEGQIRECMETLSRIESELACFKAEIGQFSKRLKQEIDSNSISF